MKLLTFAATAAMLMAAPPALAVVVLDQDNIMSFAGPVVASSIGGAPVRRQAQEVTAGQTGQLVRIDLQLGRLGVGQTIGTAPLLLELVAGGAAALPANLGSAALSVNPLGATSAASLVSVDVSSLNFNVTAGQQFTILLGAASPATTDRFSWLFGYDTGVDADNDGFSDIVSRSYAGGDNYLRDNVNFTNWFATGFDRGFATFVDVAGAAVPEPASWALMIAGFGLTGTALRRRRVAAA